MTTQSPRHAERAVALDVLVEIASRDVLEDQVVTALVDASIVDRDDVGMFERLGAPGLAQESLEERRSCGPASGSRP